MTIQFSIEWDNPSHSLLANGNLGLLLDGKPVAPTKKSAGRREFTIADSDIVPGKTKLVLTGGFFLSAGEVEVVDQARNKKKSLRKVPPMTADVLRVRQEYSFKSVDELVFVPANGFNTQHPLVVTTHTPGVAKAHVYTHWVDVTAFWDAYSSEIEVFQKEKPASIGFRALAYTGDSKEWIWLACTPSAAKSADVVGAVVHFPYPITNYSGVIGTHDMFHPNRFLLSPDPSEPPTGDTFRRAAFTPPITINRNCVLRGGFLKGLEDSGKKAVLFYVTPRPIGFGPSVTKQMPKMVDWALRLLHAETLIGVGQKSVKRTRLALSGYSGGGPSVASALAANLDQIDELYAMDLAGFKAGSVWAEQWFKKQRAAGVQPCLRMTGSLQAKENRALFQALGGAAVPDISIDPPADIGLESAYMLPTAPPDPSKPKEHGNAYWNESLKDYIDAGDAVALGKARIDGFARHQFGMQGAPGPLAGGQYFAHFMADSHFP